MTGENLFDASRHMTVAGFRLAEQRWLRQTSFRQRREVGKYLKKGQVHPDLDLAERAYRWAKAEVRFNLFRNTKAGPLVYLAVFLVPGFTTAVIKLRVARRIVNVYELNADFLQAMRSEAAGDIG